MIGQAGPEASKAPIGPWRQSEVPSEDGQTPGGNGVARLHDDNLDYKAETSNLASGGKFLCGPESLSSTHAERLGFLRSPSPTFFLVPIFRLLVRNRKQAIELG